MSLDFPALHLRLDHVKDVLFPDALQFVFVQDQLLLQPLLVLLFLVGKQDFDGKGRERCRSAISYSVGMSMLIPVP